MTDPQRIYDPAGFDFQLKPGSAAIDAGILLPNINDDFTGRGPDLGAYELGKPIPQYGPRQKLSIEEELAAFLLFNCLAQAAAD